MANAHVFDIYFLFVYTNERGLRHCLSSTGGRCESLVCGMSNSSDTRASFFGVFWKTTIKFKIDLAFWGVDAAKKEGTKTMITMRKSTMAFMSIGLFALAVSLTSCEFMTGMAAGAAYGLANSTYYYGNSNYNSNYNRGTYTSSSTTTSTPSIEKTLQTESDGFSWYELQQGDKRGAQSASGTTLIPLSRGYTFICYHTTAGGWFSTNKHNQGGGTCDKNGKEIVAPGRYDNAYYRNDDGYEYCMVKLNGKYGICDMNGREIIAPRYDNVVMHESDGLYYFGVELNGKKGACDMSGREIIAPKYESLIASGGVFKYENASGKWVSTGIAVPKSYACGNTSNSSSLPSSSASTASTSSSPSNTSSGSKKDDGLLYQGDYTEGTLVGQRTGWTMPPGIPQHFGISIYEDHLEDMGTWKYEGKSMNGCRIYSITQGWGSSAQTVKYYVDGNFNITCYREVCAFDCEVYVSQFSKGNITYDINNVAGQGGGGWNGSNSNNGSNSGNTQTQQKTHKCGLCGGTGRVATTDGVTSFGKTKWCSECGKTVPDNHYHTTCPSCKGKGYW